MSMDPDSPTQVRNAARPRQITGAASTATEKWGGFGRSKVRMEPNWWCWEHYPQKPNGRGSKRLRSPKPLASSFLIW